MNKKEVALIRTPPTSPESEQAVLGSMLMSQTATAEGLKLLRNDDFHFESHRQVFDAIRRMQSRPEPVAVDILTLTEELRRLDRLQSIGGSEYVLTLADSVPTSKHIGNYARQVEQQAIKRRLLAAAERITSRVFDDLDDGDLEALIRGAKDIIDSAAERRIKKSITGGMTLVELMATTFPPTQWAIPGMIAEGLNLIVGASKTGKSVLTLQLCLAIASGGVALGSIPVEKGDVLLLALEDPYKRLQKRAGKMLHELPAPDGMTIFTKWPRIDEGGLEDLDQWIAEHPGVRFVVIDTLAKVLPAGNVKDRRNAYELDYQRISPLWELARDRRVSLVIVHHFNKSRDTDDWMNDVSGTTGIIGVADCVIGFYADRKLKTVTLKFGGRDLDNDEDRVLVRDDELGWRLDQDAQKFMTTDWFVPIARFLVYEGRGCKPHEIAAGLRANQNTTRDHLAKGLREGWLHQDEHGLYYLSGIVADTFSDLTSKSNTTPTTATTRTTAQQHNGKGAENCCGVVPTVVGVVGVVPVVPVALFCENGTDDTASVATNAVFARDELLCAMREAGWRCEVPEDGVVLDGEVVCRQWVASATPELLAAARRSLEAR